MKSIIVIAAAVCCSLAAGAQAAPSTSTVNIVPTYAAGSKLTYAISSHATIGTAGAPNSAQLDTDAEVEMDILPGATPGNYEAELHFLKFATTVQAASAESLAPLKAQSAATDAAAMAIAKAPAHFRLSSGKFEIVSRPEGADYDQPMLVLEELVRTDSLPAGPAQVGSKWTKQRSRPIPTMNYSVLLTYDCALTALGSQNDQPTATVQVHSTGSTALPPGSVPGTAELAKQGLVPETTLTFRNDTTDLYRSSDGILLQQTSETHNLMHMRLIGPSPEAQVIDSNINSTGSVKLESITPPKA